jgi:hypothetical protein
MTPTKLIVRLIFLDFHIIDTKFTLHFWVFVSKFLNLFMRKTLLKIYMDEKFTPGSSKKLIFTPGYIFFWTNTP